MRVVLTQVAENDLGSIFTYIEKDLQNPTAARNIATKILRRIQYLESFPEAGASLGENDPKFNSFRYLVVDNYLTFYKVDDDQVLVLRILYARSNYLQLLGS